MAREAALISSNDTLHLLNPSRVRCGPHKHASSAFDRNRRVGREVAEREQDWIVPNVWNRFLSLPLQALTYIYDPRLVVHLTYLTVTAGFRRAPLCMQLSDTRNITALRHPTGPYAITHILGRDWAKSLCPTTPGPSAKLAASQARSLASGRQTDTSASFCTSLSALAGCVRQPSDIVSAFLALDIPAHGIHVQRQPACHAQGPRRTDKDHSSSGQEAGQARTKRNGWKTGSRNSESPTPAPASLPRTSWASPRGRVDHRISKFPRNNHIRLESRLIP